MSKPGHYITSNLNKAYRPNAPLLDNCPNALKW